MMLRTHFFGAFLLTFGLLQGAFGTEVSDIQIAEKISCTDFFSQANQVLDFANEVCDHPILIPFKAFFKPLDIACTATTVIGTVSEIVDQPLCNYVDHNGKRLIVKTLVTGICTTDFNNIDNQNCPAITIDYDCNQDRYLTGFSEGPTCTYTSNCQSSYTRKYQASCEGSSVYSRTWLGLDSACTFSPMKVRYQQDFCSSSKSMTIENFNCSRTDKPMTVFQFLHDGQSTIQSFVGDMYNWLNISSAVPEENFNVTLVDANTFNTDPLFAFNGADFYFAYDDRNLNNPNAMNSVACKLISMKYTVSSDSSLLSPSSLLMTFTIFLMALFTFNN